MAKKRGKKPKKKESGKTQNLDESSKSPETRESGKKLSPKPKGKKGAKQTGKSRKKGTAGDLDKKRVNKKSPEEEKFCTHCGHQLRPDDTFCGKCGSEYKSEAPEVEDKVEEKEPEEPKEPVAEEPDSKPKKRQSISVVPFVIIAGIIGAAIWWYVNLPPPKTPATITFVLESDLTPDEPKTATVNINGEPVMKTDTNGRATFIYRDAYVGDTLVVSFSKVSKTRYDSKSDFDLVVSEEVMLVERKLRFRKWVPPITWYNVDVTFRRKGDFPVTIMLNGDSIGAFIDNKQVKYKNKFKAKEKKRLEFSVVSPGLKLVTKPKRLVYKINKNISSTVNIYALLDTTPVIRWTLLEELSKTPLKGAEIKFSDTKERIESDASGLIQYSIRERKIGGKISFTLPQKFIKLKTKIAPIILTRGMPDTLSDTLLCQVKYTIRVKVSDFNENVLPGAVVILEEKEKKITDEKGVAEFQIPRPDRFYKIDVTKDRYKAISTTVRPIGFIHTEPIALEGTYGTLFVVDSLALGTPVPYLNIYEGTVNIGQTGKDGKCKIPILLAKPMTFVLKPASNSIYMGKEVETVFNKPFEIKRIVLSQKPFRFRFEVKNDRGESLQNVRITHRGSSYSTNKRGVAIIDLFTLNPAPQEEFEITYYNYHDQRFVPVDSEERNYTLPVIIGSKVPIEIRTNPPNGDVKIYDMNDDVVDEGVAPLNLELEYMVYRFVASNDKGQSVEMVLEINANSQKEPLVLDMYNPVAQIEGFYNEGNYARVVQIYSRDQQRVEKILANQTPYKDNRCAILKHIATSFGKEEQFEKAAEIMGILDENCPENSPIFYRNYAEILFQIGEWRRAAENYEKALVYISLIRQADRYQFDADCNYKQAVAMLNHYQQNKTNPEFQENSCSYLDDIQEKLDYLITIAEKNNLKVSEVNINNIMQRLWEEKKNCRG